MNILFLHRDFPAQFKHLVEALKKDNNVFFITNNTNTKIEGVKKIAYNISEQTSGDNYLNSYEEALLHAKASAKIALELKEHGFNPDIIYAHSWGPSMFIKDIFPDVPLICYFEWFYNAQNTDFDFMKKQNSEQEKEQLRCKNANILIDLYSCDAGISPTLWQKSQFPKEFHDKIKVLHDGIDTDICKPDKDAKLRINENLELSAQDEVITYATRGLEPYRGFPVFIKAAEILLKKRPNAQIVIAGRDYAYYGMKLTDTTYKELMLRTSELDLSRVHFVDKLPYEDYIKLLQISSAHVYLTFPFVLSWSFLEAMACECPIVASNTQPVLEVMQDSYNGLLTDFFNVNGLSEKIEYALDNPNKMQIIRQNARKTILENYSLKHLLPRHIDFINRLSQVT